MAYPYNAILHSNGKEKMLIYTIEWINLIDTTLSKESQKQECSCKNPIYMKSKDR